MKVAIILAVGILSGGVVNKVGSVAANKLDLGPTLSWKNAFVLAAATTATTVAINYALGFIGRRLPTGASIHARAGTNPGLPAGTQEVQ